jgi:hypothetical protein
VLKRELKFLKIRWCYYVKGWCSIANRLGSPPEIFTFGENKKLIQGKKYEEI